MIVDIPTLMMVVQPELKELLNYANITAEISKTKPQKSVQYKRIRFIEISLQKQTVKDFNHGCVWFGNLETFHNLFLQQVSI